jgi:hypothetical protein
VRRLRTIWYVAVNSISAVLVPGVIYISERYATAVHLCCCGCGYEVVTPLKDLSELLQGVPFREARESLFSLGWKNRRHLPQHGRGASSRSHSDWT